MVCKTRAITDDRKAKRIKGISILSGTSRPRLHEKRVRVQTDAKNYNKKSK